MQVICILIRQQELILDFVDACFRFGVKVAWSDEAVFIELPMSAEFFTINEVLQSLEDLAQQMNIQTRMCVANDAATALAYAHLGEMPKEKLPIESLKYFYSPFKNSTEILPTLKQLKILGFKNLSDFKNYLPGAIEEKFGPLVLEALYRFRSKKTLSWPGFMFLEKEKVELPVYSLEIAS